MRDSSTPLLTHRLKVPKFECRNFLPPILSFPGFRSALGHLVNNQSYVTVVDPNRHLYPGHSVCGHLIVSLSFTGIDDTMMLTSSRYRARNC